MSQLLALPFGTSQKAKETRGASFFHIIWRSADSSKRVGFKPSCLGNFLSSDPLEQCNITAIVCCDQFSVLIQVIHLIVSTDYLQMPRTAV